jgi:hypothetical protein
MGNITGSTGNTPLRSPRPSGNECVPSFAFIPINIHIHFGHLLLHSSRVGVAIETLWRSSKIAANNNNLSLSVRALCLADAKERQNGKMEFVEFNSCCMTKQ